MKNGDHPKSLPEIHPAKGWASSWSTMSLVDQENNSPIVIDGQKIIMPKGLQLNTVVSLHKATHVPVERM